MRLEVTVESNAADVPGPDGQRIWSRRPENLLVGNKFRSQ